MSRIKSEVRIKPSVFDRLLDFEPDVMREAPKTRAKSLRELKQAVRRDLEWLLNTRAFPEGIPARLEEVHESLAIFGLPEFSGTSIKNPSDQKRLVRALETAVRVFEPRLMDVRIDFDPPNEVERSLRFRIEAQLKVDPLPEPVTFDTILEIGRGEFEIKEV